MVHTGHGRTITVDAPAASAGHTYIHGLKVDGRTSTKPWVPDSLVTRGGHLDFTLGTTADTTWGSAPADAPPSFPGGGLKYFTGASPDQLKTEPGSEGARTVVKVQSLETKATTVHWTADPPAGITVTPSEGDFTVPARGAAQAKLTVSAGADTAEGYYTVPVTLKSSTGEELPKTSAAVTVAERDSLLWNRNSTGISADDAELGGADQGAGLEHDRSRLHVLAGHADVAARRHGLVGRFRLRLAAGAGR